MVYNRTAPAPWRRRTQSGSASQRGTQDGSDRTVAKRTAKSRSPERVALPLWVPFIAGACLGALSVAWMLTGWLAAVPRSKPNPALDAARAAPDAWNWTDQPAAAFPVPPYARFLQDVRVMLDPGHVGQRDRGGNWKRGPTGLREAVVNLRVAQYLREFLLAAGADVRMTRDEDRSLDLPDREDLRARAELANDWPADLLLSIHHNGVDNPKPNYTSLFYHSSDGHSRASACAAQWMLSGLNDALRLEDNLECAVLDDRVLFDRGLAVLRNARVPAVLSESSFHSNPDEEVRLRDPVYNRREAYGLFLGIARWAQAGLPRVRVVTPKDKRVRSGGRVTIALDDGLSARGGWGAERHKIDADSILVRVNDAITTYEMNWSKRQLTLTLPRRLSSGTCAIWVDFTNVFGQPVLHPRLELTLQR